MKLFENKIGRAKFFSLHVLSAVATVLSGIGAMIVGSTIPHALGVYLALAVFGFTLVFAFYNITVWSARLRACNWSPIVQIVRFVPVAGFALTITLLLKDGD